MSLGFIYMSSMNQTKPVEVTQTNHSSEPVRSSSPSKYYIHICGEVKSPGVYEFTQKPRVVEVIEKAGGFTKKADQACVNQAQTVEDGSQLVIEAKQGKRASKAGAESTDSSDGKVNINQATKEQLMTLSGIGEAKANQIIAYREDHGSFATTEEIKKISGIKDGVYNQIKDLIKV